MLGDYFPGDETIVNAFNFLFVPNRTVASHYLVHVFATWRVAAGVATVVTTLSPASAPSTTGVSWIGGNQQSSQNQSDHRKLLHVSLSACVGVSRYTDWRIYVI
jgi:hypothetical protein